MEIGMVKYIGETFDVNIPLSSSGEELEIFLAERINYLIVNNFSSLVQILYRIDVSEQKIKTLLKENASSNAGRIIASLVIERQVEKWESRKKFNQNKDDIDNEEAW